jgi:hypothetical protein
MGDGMKRVLSTAAAAAVMAIPAAAQDGGLAATCAGLPGGAEETCRTVAQAAESTQPQLGILIAGGNPILGTASTSGVRLGFLPRVTAGMRVNVVGARVPDITLDQGAIEPEIEGTISVPAASVGANAAIGLTQGFTLGPTVGGFGAIDLLGSATWLPFRAFDVEGFGDDAAQFAFGGGVRIGLLRESFVTPGVSVSVTYHNLGTVTFGEVCPGGVEADGFEPVGFTDGVCAGAEQGDVGEFEFDLSGLSYRGVVSKRLMGLGLAAGVGFDDWESDVRYAFRYPQPGAPTITRVRRSPEVTVENGRWSAFANASFAVLVGTISLEGGWMQGGDPIEGFPSTSDFDPDQGHFFGSVGVRLSL